MTADFSRVVLPHGPPGAHRLTLPPQQPGDILDALFIAAAKQG